MALFFSEDSHPAHGKLTGFDRYREVLERDAMSFFLGGLLSLAGFLPFGVGMIYAILSSSVLVMLAASVIGGLFAGPALYGMYDLLFRSLRDAPTDWWHSYRKAIREHWKDALLPGIVFCLFLGITAFAALLLFWWPVTLPTPGTILLFFTSLLLSTMIFSIYWPQLVLFEQTTGIRLKNCLLFCLRYFLPTVGAAAIQVGYWVLWALLLPWSILLLPLIGFWFVLFLSNFLLYNPFNQAFGFEAAIRAQFPEQAPVYEEDE